MLLDGRYMTDDYRMWLTNGGQATLLSFGTVRHAREIEDKYWDFLEGLEFYFELPDYFLVHAGFNFEVETKEEMLADRYSMIWARYWYDTIKMEFLDNKKIVHGHTPAPLFEIQKIVDASSNIIDIDGGCYSQRYGYGNLIALNLTSYKLIHCARIDEPLDY
jgi:serine/threonine protein phosphatase 1